MADNDVRYSLSTDGIPDLEDLWADNIEKYGAISKDENQENLDKSSQVEENKLKKKHKIKKMHILIAIYIILVITELFLFVPYHKIQIFVSNQNVPHTDIIGSGYTTMFEISNDDARIINGNTSRGKIVDTSQVIVNVSITTIVATGIYFILQKKEKTKDNTTIKEN